MNNLSYKIQFDAKNNVSSAFSGINKNLSEVQEKAKKVNGQFVKLTDICSKMNTINLSAIVSNVRNVAEGFSAVSASGVQFEQNLANLSSITGLIGDDLQYIADKAKETGKASGLGAAGAVDAFALLASQIQIDKIGMEGLAMLQRETITLAQASGMNMADAATAMAATINQFGLQADQANRVINVLAAGSKYGAAEISDLAQSFKVTGSVAAAAGLSVEQTAGALEVLSKSNLKGAEAGTALRNIIVKLQTALGLDLSKTGLANALDALRPKLSDTAYLAKLFGAENLAASQFLIKNADAVREMTDSVTGTKVAMEQANIRTNTTAEAMKRMQARIDGFKISIFEMTGGLSAVAAEVAGWGVTIAQLYPVLGTLNNVFGKMITSLPVIATYLQDVKLFTVLLSIRIQHLASSALSSAVLKVTAFTKALSFQTIATKAATAAQTLLNVALKNNPIGWAVTAIAALIAGLVAAYKKCDWFRELVDKAWASVKQFGAQIADHLVGVFKKLCTWIGKAWNSLKSFLGIQTGNEMADSQEEVADSADKATSALQGEKVILGDLKTVTDSASEGFKYAANTLGGFEERINSLKDAQKSASLEQAAALQTEISLLEERKNAFERSMAQRSLGNIATNQTKVLSAPSIGKLSVPSLAIPLTFDFTTFDIVKEQLKARLTAMGDEVKKATVDIGNMIGNSIASFADSLGQAVTSGNGLEALKTMLTAMMDMLSQFGQALIAAGTASLALKAVAWNGIGAIIAGGALVAATAAAKAALQNATAFADGGIVSGPTYALVGEYAGARNNPEVIAPLDKLRTLITPAYMDPGSFRLETKVRGRDLYVMLQGIEREKNGYDKLWQ